MTPRQKECYDFLCRYIAEHVISPSYAEIGAALGTKSKSVVFRLLNGLEAQGLVSRIPHRVRTIIILPTDDVYLENSRLKAALEYIATYRYGYDGTETGRLGLYAFNELNAINESSPIRTDETGGSNES